MGVSSPLPIMDITGLDRRTDLYREVTRDLMVGQTVFHPDIPDIRAANSIQAAGAIQPLRNNNHHHSSHSNSQVRCQRAAKGRLRLELPGHRDIQGVSHLPQVPANIRPDLSIHNSSR